MMVPNSPGGGYDLTARTAVKIMEDDGLTGRVEVFNVVGDSGAVAMARLMNEAGNDELMMTMGLGVVGATITHGAGVRVSDATALAKLIEDPGALVVPADSPLRTVGEFVAAWRADPGSVTVGGGSSPGGPDHLLAMELADAVGVDPREVDYVTHDGGGDLLTALLGAEVTVSTSSPGEFLAQIAAGQLRVLAVSSAARVPGVDAPTLRESGIDLTFANWRGVLAPPGVSADARANMIELLTRLHGTAAWQAALARNGWTDAFVTGTDFERFLAAQDDRVSATLAELGLT
ncbi:MAG: tripartite tricarboxylate transporter substrate-binding protein [Actinomycetota bacterium]|nr:tripartite tricarboxylate transporter substrate-binding protein [Actinomycetota bacterium]